MSSEYTPTPTPFTEADSITIPSDGDGPGIKAADVNPAFEALADGLAYASPLVGNRIDELTSASGTWTCPPGVTKLRGRSCGGGGGGGGSCGGNTVATTTSAPGGGGGGGSPPVEWEKTVVPGTIYDYTCGDGGTNGFGGGSGAAGTAGASGGDSTFDGDVVARGAQGGAAASALMNTTTKYGMVPGGRPVRASIAQPVEVRFRTDPGTGEFAYPNNGGQGGAGASTIGQYATEGGGCGPYAGGALGAPGPTDGAYKGGGGGGGGGAGAFGPGGTGCPGATGEAVGGGIAGNGRGEVPTADADDNTGAGGGGAGGGGQSNVGGSGVGADGGLGGSGKHVLFYAGAQAVFT